MIIGWIFFIVLVGFWIMACCWAWGLITQRKYAEAMIVLACCKYLQSGEFWAGFAEGLFRT